MQKEQINEELISNFYNKLALGELPEVFSMSLPITLIQKSIYTHAEIFLKEKFDMLHSELDVLAALYSNNRVLTPTQLYDLTIFSSGGMTKILKRLEARGFIRREADRSDKRCMLVVVTQSGEEITKRVLEEISIECACYFEVFDAEEKRLFASLLKRVVLNMSTIKCSTKVSATHSP